MIKINVKNFNFNPDYFTKLLGCIHKWLGYNAEHDSISLYTYSHIHKDHFYFDSYDPEFENRLKEGISKDPKMWGSVFVESVKPCKRKLDKKMFISKSPILCKRDGKHYSFADKETKTIIKEIIKRKAKAAGLSDISFKIVPVRFSKTKLIRIHNIDNKCFVCGFLLLADKETKRFITSVGIGSSTGCGFGFVY